MFAWKVLALHRLHSKFHKNWIYYLNYLKQVDLHCIHFRHSPLRCTFVWLLFFTRCARTLAHSSMSLKSSSYRCDSICTDLHGWLNDLRQDQGYWPLISHWFHHYALFLSLRGPIWVSVLMFLLSISINNLILSPSQMIQSVKSTGENDSRSPHVLGRLMMVTWTWVTSMTDFPVDSIAHGEMLSSK